MRQRKRGTSSTHEPRAPAAQHRLRARAPYRIAFSWRLQLVSGGLQLLGIALAALGVAVVRSWLEAAADTTIDAKNGLDRWWALQRRQLANRWARLRGRPVVVQVAGASAGASGGGASVSVGHASFDRDVISDRAWLAFLNDQIDGLRSRINDVDQARREDRREFDERLASQAVQLRAEMLRVTQRGWQLIIIGLCVSALGTVVGMV